MEDKRKLQSKAIPKYYEQIFEEMKKLEEKQSEDAMLRVQIKGRFMEISEPKRGSKNAAEIWKNQEG